MRDNTEMDLSEKRCCEGVACVELPLMGPMAGEISLYRWLDSTVPDSEVCSMDHGVPITSQKQHCSAVRSVFMVTHIQNGLVWYIKRAAYRVAMYNKPHQITKLMPSLTSGPGKLTWNKREIHHFIYYNNNNNSNAVIIVIQISCPWYFNKHYAIQTYGGVEV